MKLSQAKEYLPFVQAAMEGKTIQYKGARPGFIPNCWVDDVSGEIDLENTTFVYRIKPTPTLRPWKPEEVPVGALIRSTNKLVYLIVARSLYEFDNTKCIRIVEDVGARSYSCEHVKNWEHSLDQAKTWLPCGVVE